jgi:predicted PurR-regulated permease PerM
MSRKPDGDTDIDAAGVERAPAINIDNYRLLVGLAAVVLIITGIRAASGLLGQILLALMLTVAVLPAGQWALRKGWPRWAAGLFTVLCGFSILVVVVGGVAISIVQLVATLPNYSARAESVVQSMLNKLAELGVDTSSANTALSKIDVGAVVGVLKSVLGGVLHSAAALFFVATLLLFMAVDALAVTQRGERLRDANPDVMRVLTDFAKGTQNYLIVSAIFGGIVAVLDAGALWALGVPLAFTWGLLSFLTNFIPNIGFVIGVIPPALLALLDSGWHKMVAVFIVYTVLNVVIQTFIQPRFVGDTVGLSPTTTFLALAFWGYALGPLGALLAVPVTLLVRAVFIDGRPSEPWMKILFGSGSTA